MLAFPTVSNPFSDKTTDPRPDSSGYQGSAAEQCYQFA